MDENRFRQNQLSNSSGQYQSLPAQYNNIPSSYPSNILPPLHYPTPLYTTGSNQHVSHTSPSSTTASNPSLSAAQGHPTLRPIQPSPSYAFSNSQASLHPSSAAHANGHILAQAPLVGGLHDVRAGGIPGLVAHQQHLYPQSFAPSSEPEPLHVVGQQGRRGVLPTIPGRPAPASGKAPLNPTKNADNKYECPHCVKTYQHLKHLKRHLLRHTGERPYQCHLCKDTFSRSDILKRHFQKCSIRRGNPTGANHLTHAQNHLQKNNRLSANGAETSSYLSHINTSVPFSDGNSYANPLMAMPPMPAEAPPFPEALPPLSARTSRSNSLIRPNNGAEEHRRSMSGVDMANSRVNFDPSNFRGPSGLQNNLSQDLNSYNHQQNQSPGQNPNSVNAYGYDQVNSNTEMSQSLPVKVENAGKNPYGRSSVPNANGLRGGGQENGMRWDGSFNPESQDYLLQSSMTSGEVAQVSMFHGLYTTGPGFDGQPVLGWSLDASDPLQNKAESLISFCYPDPSSLAQDSPDAHALQTLKNLLTADNLKHFVEGYKNFHAHWPMLHMPTFDPLNTSNSLLLAIVCVGAVYSDRLNVHDVRWLMGVAKSSIQRSSHVCKAVAQSPALTGNLHSSPSSDFDEIAALCLLHALFIWHGNPAQRQEGRADFYILVAIAKRFDLVNPIPKGHSEYSVLHQHGAFNMAGMPQWSWIAWVGQEKLIRAFYLIFLLDTALGIFFNCTPQFEISDIRIPLPADDCAWEARTSEECAAALGLRGEAAQANNRTGSRRPRQMDMCEAVQFFLKTDRYAPRATNAFGKFIVIHALHNQILRMQRQIHAPAPPNPRSAGVPSGGSTPHSQTDWPSREDGNSSSGTPTSAVDMQPSMVQQSFRHLLIALERWRSAWEQDQAIQYPAAQRRAGYCRDAIHYFYLGMMFVRSSRREDWQAPPDMRCQQVFSLLKKIKAYVHSEQEKRGYDIGSVSSIDDNYGVEDLTLDMKLLFTPISEPTD